MTRTKNIVGLSTFTYKLMPCPNFSLDGFVFIDSSSRCSNLSKPAKFTKRLMQRVFVQKLSVNMH